MTVLVAYASPRGSTNETAQAIGDRLLKGGFRVAVRPLAEVAQVKPYEAVVLGSDLQQGEWLPSAIEFLTRHARELAQRPVWLFSVSPEAAPPGPRSEPSEHPIAPRLARLIQPKDQRGFVRHTERGEWEKASALLWKVCAGSSTEPAPLRDVNDWANGIARELQALDRVKERRRLHLRVRGKP